MTAADHPSVRGVLKRADDARALIARLCDTGDAVPLDLPVPVRAVLDGSLEECQRLAAINADLAARITAARQDAFRYLRKRGDAGDLARNVEAALAPRNDHPDEVA